MSADIVMKIGCNLLEMCRYAEKMVLNYLEKRGKNYIKIFPRLEPQPSSTMDDTGSIGSLFSIYPMGKFLA